MEVNGLECMVNKNNNKISISKFVYVSTSLFYETSKNEQSFKKNHLALDSSGISSHNHNSSADASTSVGSNLHLVSHKLHPNHGYITQVRVHKVTWIIISSCFSNV